MSNPNRYRLIFLVADLLAAASNHLHAAKPTSRLSQWLYDLSGAVSRMAQR